jgi:hypothetical protein
MSNVRLIATAICFKLTHSGGNDGHISTYDKPWLGNAFKPRKIVRERSGYIQ